MLTHFWLPELHVCLTSLLVILTNIKGTKLTDQSYFSNPQNRRHLDFNSRNNNNPLNSENVQNTKHNLINLGELIEESDNLDISSPIYNPCLAFLKEFGKNTASFVQCSVENAQPFRFCTHCVVQYQRSMTVFQDILQDDATHSGCSEILLKADRIQVLNQLYNNIKAIWNQAYCDDCFIKDSIQEDKNGTVIFEYTDAAKEFNASFNNMTHCIKKHSNVSLTGLSKHEHNESVCEVCLPIYKALNSKFKDAMKRTDQQVCNDLVDMMNFTRITWGFKLNCTRNYATNPFVILISVFIALGTVCFYVITGVRGRRKAKTVMKQKRMSSRSAAALYGTTMESTLMNGNSLTRTEVSE